MSSASRQAGRCLQRLEHGRGHREDAGIARGHDDDPASRCGQRQRLPGASELLAIVGGVDA